MGKYSPEDLKTPGCLHVETMVESSEDEAGNEPEWEEVTVSSIRGSIVLRLIEDALYLGITEAIMPHSPPETMVRLTVRQAAELRDELSALLDCERVSDY